MRLPHGRAGAHEAAGEGLGVLEGLHEGAGSRLDVEDQALGSLRDFLGEDGGGYQGNGFDGGGDVAQCVEFFVGGHDALGLARHGEAVGGDPRAEGGEVEAGAVAGDGFELVEGAAGVSEGAARHHGHLDAAGRDDGRQGQGDLVADAAGGMLVHEGARDARQVHPVARLEHGGREGGGFGRAHALEEYGHEQGRHLVLGNGAGHVAVDDEADFALVERLPEALLHDDVYGSHISPLRYAREWIVYFISGARRKVLAGASAARGRLSGLLRGERDEGALCGLLRDVVDDAF